jgi:molecular chaperone GrpE (heat shock protein)
MITNILSNIDKKEEEIEFIRRELEDSKTTIKEQEKLCEDNAAPEYVTSFATGLKRNVDELISIMGVLKTSIDHGAKDIANMTTSVANKYRFDNEQLHKDVQNFKQRAEKEKIDSKERANERLIKSLMNTLFNID